jgi:hypothetical protein
LKKYSYSIPCSIVAVGSVKPVVCQVNGEVPKFRDYAGPGMILSGIANGFETMCCTVSIFISVNATWSVGYAAGHVRR